jgi:hypothetical protein
MVAARLPDRRRGAEAGSVHAGPLRFATPCALLRFGCPAVLLSWAFDDGLGLLELAERHREWLRSLSGFCSFGLHIGWAPSAR